jgi:glycosyltransferase involved in cell wall biosynthesis
LESWLHKKPIIAFNGPAMNEVIDHEQNGLLSNLWDTEDLAQKINFLYEHPDLIQKYGEDGFKKLNTYYTLKRMTDETEEVYKYLINGKRLLNQEIEN